jgi:hypothetical protein
MEIYAYGRAVPEDACFVRSEATGQIYAMSCLPMFTTGLTVVTRADYIAYLRAHHYIL